MPWQRERERRGKRGTQRDGGRAPAPGPALRRRTPGRLRILFFAVLIGCALGIWALVRQRTTPPPPPPVSTIAMADSTLAADEAKDFEGVLRWARSMAAAEPSDPALVLVHGLALHNYSFVGSRHGRERSATRTSLDRIEMESRALALIDFAAAGMRSNESWAEAMTEAGQVYENLGLPLDALRYYTAVRERLPDYPPVLPRVVFIAKSLRDPLTIPSGPSPLTSPQARGTPAPG